jgi:hypothetical protein
MGINPQLWQFTINQNLNEVRMKQTKPSITFRFGAAHDDITVDGRTFVRHKFSRAEQGSMRRIVVGALESIGYFQKGKSN